MADEGEAVRVRHIRAGFRHPRLAELRYETILGVALHVVVQAGPLQWRAPHHGNTHVCHQQLVQVWERMQAEELHFLIRLVREVAPDQLESSLVRDPLNG